jgi:hypothetical protein
MRATKSGSDKESARGKAPVRFFAAVPAVLSVLLLSFPPAGLPAARSEAGRPSAGRVAPAPPAPVVLVAADPAPVIDGRLDDPIWSRALKFTDFKTFKPDFRKDPSQRTEAYLAYDPDNFYFAFRCFDTDPGKVKATMCKRDAIFNDDVAGLIIDTFNDNQSGFSFLLNPLGVQGDGMLNVLGNLDDTHDMVWYGKGTVDDQGWTVEARVPLKSLRFPNKKTTTMKVVFLRFFTRTSEQATFPALDPDNSSIMTQAQPIQVSGLHYQRVMEFLPAVTYANRHEAQDGAFPRTESTRFRDMYSVTGKFGLTSDLMLDGAYNPDFSQVESDAGQVDVNLRYPNYYQEKRPFFLEGQDLWQFGGLVEDAPLQSIVYTRTIANPDYGFRLTGKVGLRDTVAAIYARDYLPDDGVDAHPDFVIGRYKHSFAGDSYLGGFYTSREAGSVFNRVGGVDGRIRLGQPSVISFHLFGSSSRGTVEEGAGEAGVPGAAQDASLAHALSIDYAYQTRKWSAELGYQDISQNFQVDTGFLTRTGLRRVSAFTMYQIYPKSNFLQKIEPFYWGYHLYDTFSDLWESFNIFVARLYLPRSIQLRFEGIAANEVYAGHRFGTSGYGMRVQGQVLKQLYVQLFGRRTGKVYYDEEAPYQGYGYRAQAMLLYQPVEKLAFGLDLTYSDFYRSADRERIYDYTIVRSRNAFQVNKYLFVRGIVEYNFYRRRLTADALVSFTYIPGTVFYVGYGSAYERTEWNGNEYVDSERFLQTKAGFFFKMSYLWRF